ncbi:MarR family winged helix-turn-helix transcriptional regulator [Glycomyces salinus]|uniref:MarR family winged helix-turn-helix transcriptional regulator n=1 Tax=Glycomyces salinus TaxID=980294 RepID=UPI0018ECA8D0|nr:MarR family transcriptional regulator [Glycomyces salinus]
MSETLRVREMACFALHSAARAVTGYYRPLLDRLGLTYPQFLILVALWEADGRTVTALGEELDLDSGTVSPLLKRLEAAGLVERRREAADERVVTVHLTEDGKALEKDGCEIPGTIAAASDMTVEEILALRDQINRFTESIRKNTN